MLLLAVLFLFCGPFASDSLAAASDEPAVESRHLIYGKGTPQELEVHKIFGRLGGPTVMLLGGIHGNEPGAYLSADLYTNVKLKRGNLIIVPRANFRSILNNQRGSGGDMNRKFSGASPDDPEKVIVDILKSLIAESDALLTLHDGSGFFRPEWISPILNPHRYGQSIITDAAVYTVPESGKTINLHDYVERVLLEVNKAIRNPEHAFRFFNMRTANEYSLYKEQRRSATYYALTQIGIPAFCIETSHNLPDLESKVYQHNLAINAFLNLFGVEFEQPGVTLDAPILSYLLVTVNRSLSFAVPNKQTLLVPAGARVEIADVRANYERGIMVAVQGLDRFNPLREPFTVSRKTTVSVRKDTYSIGHIDIAPLPQGESFPRIAGNPRITPLHAPTPASVPQGPPAKTQAADAAPAPSPGQQIPPSPPRAPSVAATSSNSTAGFLLEVDGRSVEVKAGGTLTVVTGSRIKLLDFVANGVPPSEGTLMKMTGLAPEKAQRTGDDRGLIVDTAGDLPPANAVKGKKDVYAIQAEQGGRTQATCYIKLVQPKLATITLRYKGGVKTLGVDQRIHIPNGASFEILEAKFSGGVNENNLRVTLGGHPVPPVLPQTCIMRDIALNLRVFHGSASAGKITCVP
jgi:hypothetical protein